MLNIVNIRSNQLLPGSFFLSQFHHLEHGNWDLHCDRYKVENAICDVHFGCVYARARDSEWNGCQLKACWPCIIRTYDRWTIFENANEIFVYFRSFGKWPSTRHDKQRSMPWSNRLICCSFSTHIPSSSSFCFCDFCKFLRSSSIFVSIMQCNFQYYHNYSTSPFSELN